MIVGATNVVTRTHDKARAARDLLAVLNLLDREVSHLMVVEHLVRHAPAHVHHLSINHETPVNHRVTVYPTTSINHITQVCQSQSISCHAHIHDESWTS